MAVRGGRSAGSLGEKALDMRAMKACSSRRAKRASRGRIVFEQLEPRILLDAGPADLPDLIITSVSGPSEVDVNGSASVDVVVENAGNVASFSSVLKVLLSRDEEQDDADTSVASQSVGALAPGASWSGSVAVNLGAIGSVVEGRFHWAGLADADHAVSESAEDNNWTAGNEVKVGRLPDLRIASISGPAAMAVNGSATVSVVVENKGTTASSPCDIDLFFGEDDAVFSPADLHVGTSSVSALSPGGSWSGSVLVNLSGVVGVAPGRFVWTGYVDAYNEIRELDEGDNRLVGNEVKVGGLPDLEVIAIAGPTQMDVDGTGVVSFTVANTGTAVSGASTLDFFFAEDNTRPSAGDLKAAGTVVHSLAPGGAWSGTMPVNLGAVAGEAPGRFTWSAVVDIDDTHAELNEDNNWTAGNDVAVGRLADLVVTSVAGPAQINVDGSGIVNLAVQNTGHLASVLCTLDVFLAGDREAHGRSDLKVATWTVYPLAPGASRSAVIPVDLTAVPDEEHGRFHWGARVDSTGQVAELDEDNNYRAGNGVTVGQRPDLTVTYVYGASQMAIDGTGIVSVIVENTGSSASPESTLDLFFNTSDEARGAGDLKVATWTVPPLLAGQSWSGSSVVNLGSVAGETPGRFYWGALVDPADDLTELDEDNNWMAGNDVKAGDRPDLVVTSISGPRRIGAGGDPHVSVVVSNIGTAASPASTVDLFWSADKRWDAGDVKVGTAAVDGLSKGASWSGFAPVTFVGLPDVLPEHWYWIGFADPNDSVEELDEGNNAKEDLVGRVCDLAITSIAGPAEIDVDGTGQVTVVVENAGLAASEPAEADLFLSADREHDAGDLLATPGVAAIPAIEAGGLWTGLIDVDLSTVAGETVGWYWWVGYVDIGDDVDEVEEEGNNHCAGEDQVEVTAAPDSDPFGDLMNVDGGDGPRSLVSGDFNGDGRLDLALVNTGDDDVSVLYGQAGGRFGGRTDCAVGGTPRDIVAGDFNADGRLDLAVANFADNDVSILWGLLGGAFGSRQDYPVGAGPAGITAGDFDGDGRLDLATANYWDNTVTVLHKHAVGGYFTRDSDIPVGNRPCDLVAQDFNGGGQLDLAVVNFYDNDVSILWGLGGGDFGSRQDYAVGAQPVSIVAGQFSDDGRVDIAVANYSDDTVSVLYKKELGGYFGYRLDVAVGGKPVGVAAEDFDGDGLLDLAATNFSDGDVSILWGLAGGGVGARQDYQLGARPVGIVVGDWNSDTRLDLAAANLFDDDVSLLFGRGRAVPPGPDYPVGDGPRNMVSADFNQDGRPDLAVVNAGDNDITVLYGQASGGLGGRADYAVGGSPRDIVAADFNGDGRLDLAVANFDDGDVSVLWGLSAGAFGSRQDYGVGVGPVGIVTGDFNSNGRPDLATANYSDNTLTVLYKHATGGYFTGRQDMGVGRGPCDLATGDFNNDGRTDLAGANFSDNDVSILWGLAGGGVGSRQDYDVGAGPLAVATGDFNGDGRPDLATANYLDNTASVLYKRAVGGYFGDRQDTAVGTRPVGLAAADLNRDNRLDLAVTNFADHDASVLYGQDGGGVGGREDTTTGGSPVGIVAADFNGNEWLDLAVACSLDGSVHLTYGEVGGAVGDVAGVGADSKGQADGAAGVEAAGSGERAERAAAYALMANVDAREAYAASRMGRIERIGGGTHVDRSYGAAVSPLTNGRTADHIREALLRVGSILRLPGGSIPADTNTAGQAGG